eukprot:6186709-Pleurochrysis_carterae.AAC.2
MLNNGGQKHDAEYGQKEDTLMSLWRCARSGCVQMEIVTYTSPARSERGHRALRAFESANSSEMHSLASVHRAACMFMCGLARSHVSVRCTRARCTCAPLRVHVRVRRARPCAMNVHRIGFVHARMHAHARAAAPSRAPCRGRSSDRSSPPRPRWQRWRGRC